MTLIRYRRPGLGLWNPFEDLQSEFNRLFTYPGEESRNYVPLLDLDEQDDRFIIRVDLPGVDKKDVSLTVQEGVLTITGRREEVQESSEKGHVHRERHVGEFARSLRLPTDVDGESVKATMKDGVLTIEAPKRAEVRPRQIEIGAN